MGRIEELVTQYQNHISAPWQKNVAGAQRTVFVVYEKADERKLRAKLGLFEIATRDAKHNWKLFDFTSSFARWMAAMDYREAYFEQPTDLALKLERDFASLAANELRGTLSGPDVDENTVVAVHGVAGLFGFTKVSSVIREVENDIRGRLVLFFPGEYESNNYRLLDARDGWNYLAIPITFHGGASKS